MPDVVILVPMLGRPHRILPLLESIHHASPEARVLFCVSPNDTTVHAEIDRRGGERITVPREPYGDYQRKINAGFNATDEPLIFTGADDLLFHPGWLKRAAAQLQPGVGVVGTNDLGSPRVISGDHSTHSLITREYVDRYGIRDFEHGDRGEAVDVPGVVLYEGYPHEWCDDELVETAKFRGAWAVATDSWAEHLHPCWGKGKTDAMYQQQGQRMRRGRSIYQQRRQLWT